MKDIELPPLPESCQNGNQTTDYFGKLFEYTRQDMRSYARAAVEADRARRVPDVAEIRRVLACVKSSVDSGIPVTDGWRILDALLASTPAQPAQQEPNWWRKRADEIEVTVARSGSTEAMRCFTDMRTLLQAATAHQEPPQPVERNPITRNCPECLYSDSWGIADKAFCSQCRPTETGNGSLFHPLNERHHGIRE